MHKPLDMSRYAKKMVDNRFYGNFNCDMPTYAKKKYITRNVTKKHFIQFLKQHHAYEQFIKNFSKNNIRFSIYISFSAMKMRNILNNSFVWGNTAEGHKYWQKLNKEWEQYYDEFTSYYEELPSF